MIKVSELMTSHVVALSVNDTVQHATDVMSKGKFRHLPVLNERGKLAGIVSHRDLLRYGISHLIVDHAERQANLDRKIRLKHVMTSPVQTVSPDDSLRDCGLLVLRHHYGCLPVVDGDRLVGIVTDTDFVGLAISLIDAQEVTEEAIGHMQMDVRSRVH